MFHRLVGRTVFAKPDRVVCHDIDDALAHQRRQTDRGAAVIGEDQERAAVRNDSTVQRHAVHGGCHAVLTDTVIDVPAGEIVRRDGCRRSGLRVVRSRQIRRTTNQFRHSFC